MELTLDRAEYDRKLTEIKAGSFSPDTKEDWALLCHAEEEGIRVLNTEISKAMRHVPVFAFTTLFGLIVVDVLMDLSELWHAFMILAFVALFFTVVIWCQRIEDRVRPELEGTCLIPKKYRDQLLAKKEAYLAKRQERLSAPNLVTFPCDCAFED